MYIVRFCLFVCLFVLFLGESNLKITVFEFWKFRPIYLAAKSQNEMK